MKKTYIFALLIIIFIFGYNCCNYDIKDIQGDIREVNYKTEGIDNKSMSADIVYITFTGKCYHKAGCRYLNKSAVEMKRNKVLNKGYRPCSFCY